jgi:hypothetical protein
MAVSMSFKLNQAKTIKKLEPKRSTKNLFVTLNVLR